MDETIQLWDQFVHRDMMSYVGLWLAIRRGDWHLRVACLKETGPLFHAFDRTTCQVLIPQHLGDLCNFPQEVLNSLELGGFVANISGRSMVSVALDEAHEMLINKETKDCLVRTTPAALSKLTGYLPYQSSLLANIKSFQISVGESALYVSSTSSRSRESKNIEAFSCVLSRCHLFKKAITMDANTEMFPLKHFVTGQPAESDYGRT